MPKTRQEIDAVWESLHAKLTELYYVKKAIDKETFDKLHTAIWLFHEKESLKEGILTDYTDELTKKPRSTQIDDIITALGGETELKRKLKEVLG